MVARRPHLILLPAAYRLWEAHSAMPGTLEEVVDRLLELPPSAVHLRRVVPFADLLALTAIVDGWQVTMLGDVDDEGRWWRIREVQTQAPGVPPRSTR